MDFIIFSEPFSNMDEGTTHTPIDGEIMLPPVAKRRSVPHAQDKK